MNKHGIAIIIGLCLFGSSAASTLSYLSDQEHVENRLSFVGEAALDAVLTEPSWKAEQALLALPNTVLLKDPQITNTSVSDLDELAAVKLEFVYSQNCPQTEKRGCLLSDEDMACVADVCEIDYNADRGAQWVRFDGEDENDSVQRFYYSGILKRRLPETGDTTQPLFTRLYFDRRAGNARFLRLQEIGGFNIRISGSVLQYMENEASFGLNSPKSAYEAGLFQL